MPRADRAETVRATTTALDSAELDDVLARLRDIMPLRGLERTLAVGELILTRFYDGNVPAWRERKRNKLNSIRRLAARSDCPFSKSALNDAVAIFVMVTQLPAVRTLRHVGTSHLAGVLALSALQADEILAQAETERWSVRVLKERVAALQRVTLQETEAPSPAMSPAALVLRMRFEQLVRAVDAVSEARPTDATLATTTNWLANELSVLAARLLSIEEGPRVAEALWRPRADRSA
jgi:hypothetical protein